MNAEFIMSSTILDGRGEGRLDIHDTDRCLYRALTIKEMAITLTEKADHPFLECHFIDCHIAIEGDGHISQLGHNNLISGGYINSVAVKKLRGT